MEGTFISTCAVCGRNYQGSDGNPAMHCGECNYALARIDPLARPLIYSLVERIKSLEQKTQGISIRKNV